VLLLDKVGLLDKLTRACAGSCAGIFRRLIISAAVLGRRYYVILGGGDERHGSEEREPYDTLRERLSQGGMPTIVYNRWLRIALEKVENSSATPGARTPHGSHARCISKPMAHAGPRPRSIDVCCWR